MHTKTFKKILLARYKLDTVYFYYLEKPRTHNN